MYPSRFTDIGTSQSLKPPNNRTKHFEKIMWPAKNTVKVKPVVFKIKKTRGSF